MTEHTRSGPAALTTTFRAASMASSAFAPGTPRAWVLALILAALGVPSPAAEPPVGFIAAASSPSELGPESKAAWELASRLVRAELVLVPADGAFVDATGARVELERFKVLWYHEGDVADPTHVQGARSFPLLRKHLVQGGRLFLSGAALAMVNTMGLEPASARRGSGGRDGFVAGLIPVESGHPVFGGLEPSSPIEGVVLVADAGLPAFADFHGSGGPTAGMLLARANCGSENPLVEYAVGNGRVIAMGWRLPHFALAPNAHRANLEKLTANILSYLGDEARWRQVVIRPAASAPVAPAADPASEREALELAIRDLIETFGERYPGGAAYLARLEALPRASDAAAREELDQLRREALLANPLLDFEEILLVDRSAGNLGLPANWESNSSLASSGFDNRLGILSPARPDGEIRTLYQPDGGRFVGDVDLHFDGGRILFSMPGANGRWQVHELGVEGSGLRELPLIREPDVDNYDACYLPEGRIIFTSTAPFVGVPCVYGGSHVTNLYRLELDGTIHQLTVDQEHNWCPTVLNDGRVMYLRWEYTDLPHAHSRILFHMGPDGTGQAEYLGSNSYFVNSFFYARPIPGHPTKVVGIASGHHGTARAGRLLLADPVRGRREAEPFIQELPGRGKTVVPIIRDQLVDGVWPQFLHPWPLSEKYFIVAAKPSPGSPWGIYLIDVFDNMVLIKESPGRALLEPIPLRSIRRPPALVDRTDRRRKDALVSLTDVHAGPGLAGIPRGTVKKLRLVSYHFSYQGMGGLLGAIGMDGPWDIKRVLGTVPVEEDGSAFFRVPACTPISVQPLDGEGKALQLMRSWFTAMPGETLSCVGCHEAQNTGTPNRRTIASARTPSEITPWYGPARGFAFHREVQPVLDRHCVTCHEERRAAAATAGGGAALPPDLRGNMMIEDWRSDIAGHVDPSVGGKFSVAYAALHRHVRRPGIESDLHLLSPMDFHADSTELVQMLRRGHHGVRLEAESWDRLVTWIDLNAPYHGTWSEIVGKAQVEGLAARRRELLERYAGVDDDPEAIPEVAVLGAAGTATADVGNIDGNVVSDAAERREPAGSPADEGRAQPDAGLVERTAVVSVTPSTLPPPAPDANGDPASVLDLGEGISLHLVRVPAGEATVGDPAGEIDEMPAVRVRIPKPFWIGRFEVTNAQYARFDPAHDSHVEPMHGYQFGAHGYPLDRPAQPVVRVSWSEAVAFCEWLSGRTGRRCTLPTEAQWEHACRAGTTTPFWWGDARADFSPFANLADSRLRELALDTYIQIRVVPQPNRYDDWVPRDDRFDDGGLVSVDVGRYRPNAWGLFDAHGNVREWTRSAYRPYPYLDGDGRNEPSGDERRVARGGSWYDRPSRARASSRLAYAPYQRAFNVGFRIAVED